MLAVSILIISIVCAVLGWVLLESFPFFYILCGDRQDNNNIF